MEKNVIRCIHSVQLRDIKNGNCAFDKVGVYYGFNNYNRTAKQILELIDIIKKEVPDATMSELHVYEITRCQSDRHAGYTMINVYVDVNTVRDHLCNYTIL
jgi:UDP-N-acetylenolpyruvoylglucosamine reductase